MKPPPFPIMFRLGALLRGAFFVFAFAIAGPCLAQEGASEITDDTEIITDVPNQSGASAAVEVPIPHEGQEPESMVFDVYLGDEFRGAAVLSYTDEWFEIEDPEDVLLQLSDLKANKGDLLSLLKGRIEKQKTQPGLGTISYDLSTFRLILQPDAAFMKSRGLNLGVRIGDPEPGFSVQQTFGAATFQDTSDLDLGNASAFTHRGVASYRDIYLRTNGFFSDSQAYQLNEATLGTIVDDYEARTGFLQMAPQSFVPSLRFAGVRADTAQQIFLDNEASRGSKLEIFVPSRSTVQFYRDSQLLAVQVLDFGLQEVDTSAFPQGSYDVDIVITDSNGQQTKERRFYTKAGFLASRAKPVYYFSAGVVRDLMDIISTPLVQGGMRVRASDYFDIGTGLASTDENGIASADINGLYGGLRFGLNGAISDEGDHAQGGSLGFALLGINVTGRLVNADGAQTVSTQDSRPNFPGFVPQLANTARDLIIQNQRSRSLSVSRQFNKVSLRYDIQDNEVGLDSNRYARGPTLDWTIFGGSHSSLVFRAAHFQTDEGSNKSVQFFYRYRIAQSISLNSQLMSRWQAEQNELLGILGLSYNTQTLAAINGTTIQASEEARKLDSKEAASGDATSFTTNVQANTKTDYLNVNSFARNVQDLNGEDRLVAGLNAESSVLIANQGQVSIGRPPEAEAVFIAEVEGNLLTEDDEFDVIVNDQRMGVVSAGERGVISLAPYRNYMIRLSAREEAGLVDYDIAKYEVTLFPGNVATRTWHIDKVFVLIGRLLDEEGNPIVRERIKGAKGYGFTEADGTFQIEVTGTETLEVESRRRRCTFDLGIKEIPEYFLDVGDVVCRPDAHP